MLIDFIKMHAQGNDFVILNHMLQGRQEMDYPALARAICTPHTGFGADGLVILEPDADAAARMTIYNSDGSRAAMCGSALRCVSQILSESLNSQSFDILTDSGLKQISFANMDGAMVPAVNLGSPQLLESSLSVEQFEGSLVDVGNKHFVILTDSLDDDPHLSWGSMLEHHPTFDEGVNVHFALLLAPDKIRIKIWENAVGATLACGTGAAASVCAGIGRGYLQKDVRVLMPGGSVIISRSCNDCDYILIGPVEYTGSGVYEWKI